MLWRFIAHPKLGVADGQPCNDAFLAFMPICLDGTKRIDVELDSFATVSNKQPRCGGLLDI
jgi:hypothetical protein